MSLENSSMSACDRLCDGNSVSSAATLLTDNRLKDDNATAFSTEGRISNKFPENLDTSEISQANAAGKEAGNAQSTEKAKIVAEHQSPSNAQLLILEAESFKNCKVDLYVPDNGPKMYNIKGNLVTPPIRAKKLPEAFKHLPIYGKPKSKGDLERFYNKKIQKFVGFDLNDDTFEKLARFCSPGHLRTGQELTMPSAYPNMALFEQKETLEEPSPLNVVKRLKMRVGTDPTSIFQKRLKYRGIRLLPLTHMEDISEAETQPNVGSDQESSLEPGKDILYRVRIYRPFPYNLKEKQTASRHSVLCRDAVVAGRAALSELRDRLACANDVGMRVDAAAHADRLPPTCAKDLFPSGFLFINNVFYVDYRAGCSDTSAVLRAWAAERGLGDFPRRDLDTRVDELDIRLGHPEVYVHQGNCEHLFTFSEIRLVNADDPLHLGQYPCHTAVSSGQSVYCTTCAEFGAKWLVVGCSRVPFDPAFFCDTCLKMYCYNDDGKIGDFKAYAYRGNEVNIFKQT